MRVLSSLPEAPAHYMVVTGCTFCDNYREQFMILEHEGFIATICIECVHLLAVEALKRWGDRPISRA